MFAMLNSSTRSKNNFYKKGIFGEYVAIIYLICAGYKVIRRRYKSHFGEIDIIALKKRMVIFVEVKTRKIKTTDIFDIVNKKQQRRIRNSAEYFIICNSAYNDYNIRFDIIIVGSIMRFFHIRNAWINY